MFKTNLSYPAELPGYHKQIVVLLSSQIISQVFWQLLTLNIKFKINLSYPAEPGYHKQVHGCQINALGNTSKSVFFLDMENNDFF